MTRVAFRDGRGRLLRTNVPADRAGEMLIEIAGQRSDLFAALCATTAQLQEHPAVERVDCDLRQTYFPSGTTCEMSVTLRTDTVPDDLHLADLWDRLTEAHPDWEKYRLGWLDNRTVVLGWKA